MDWISAGTCQASARFGWLLGAATGGIADVVIVVLIASAPKLGSRRPRAAALRKKTRIALQHSLWALALVWVWGGYHSLSFACYVPTLALGCAATTAVVLLLVLFTAANQIGARSVR